MEKCHSVNQLKIYKSDSHSTLILKSMINMRMVRLNGLNLAFEEIGDIIEKGEHVISENLVFHHLWMRSVLANDIESLVGSLALFTNIEWERVNTDISYTNELGKLKEFRDMDKIYSKERLSSLDNLIKAQNQNK